MSCFQDGSTDNTLLGSYTSETGKLFTAHPDLLSLYTQCLTTSPVLMSQTLNSEFLSTVPDSGALLRTILGRNQPNHETLLPGWLITSHAIYITSSGWLFTKSGRFPQVSHFLRILPGRTWPQLWRETQQWEPWENHDQSPAHIRGSRSGSRELS